MGTATYVGRPVKVNGRLGDNPPNLGPYDGSGVRSACSEHTDAPVRPFSGAIVRPPEPPKGLLVDGSTRTDRYHVDHAPRSDTVDDPHPPYAKATEPSQLIAQRLAQDRLGTDQVQTSTNLALQLWVEPADKLGDVPWNSKTIALHVRGVRDQVLGSSSSSV